MAKFPHEYQLDTKDCGPACVKIIAKYYGRYYSLVYLRDLCGITREGVNLLDISHGCEQIGLRTLALKFSWEELKNKASLPCIVHWKNSHFVVVYRITKEAVHVSDPAKGLIRYSIREFIEGWLHGEPKWAALLVEPMAEFEQKQLLDKTERRRTLENFLGYFKPYKKSFINLFIVMFIVTILQGLLPFISKSVIDVGIQTNDIGFINLVLIANVTIIVAILLSNIVRDWILLHVTSRVNVSLISDYLIKLMKLPVSFFENKLVGDILQRANDHERIRSFMMNSSISTIFSLFTLIVFSVILCIYNPRIFILFGAGSTLFILWVLLFLRFRKMLDWEYFDLISRNQSYWVETIESIQDIKINNYEKKKRWKWEAIQARLYKVNQRLLKINNIQNLGAQFINQLTNLFITFFCAKAVLRGEITFGVMISTQFIIGMLNAPILQFVAFIQSAQAAQISFLRLNEIHQLEEEDGNVSANSIDLPEHKSLVVRNLGFQYTRNSAPVVRGVNLVIPQGRVTAIVGDSGSGKSTLLKLLMRLYNPTVGEISVGNLNLKNLNLREWRDQCGIVMQDGKIFSDTILNNIVLDDESIDYERLKRAVTTANIAAEIEALPDGYQTMMGEGGRGLSGGQKQRLLIARALYKDPHYLFFDEATNALDTVNEQKIVSALDNVFKGKTVIVVAHRLSTIRKADQIIVLKNGSVVEVGNHETMMKNEKGHYFQLLKAQMPD
jgi:ATP-binding cassette subfamily B protein